MMLSKPLMVEVEYRIEEGSLVRRRNDRTRGRGPSDLLGCVIRSYISKDLKHGHMCQVLWNDGTFTDISSIALESIDEP